MNQILSVDMPKKKAKVKNFGKANTKSVVTFFSIVLLLFGIALIGISIYSMLGKSKQPINNLSTDLPRIDVTQNATELEIEIACKNEISSIEYNWESKETKKLNGNGRNNMELTVDIPSGTNIFTIKATDSEGRTNEYSKEYVGAKEPNIILFDPSQIENTIIVKCEESQIIKYMSYYYDEEQETKKEINNRVGTLEDIKVLPGEHNLTIKVGYEDGTVGKLSKKVYAPNVVIGTNGVEQYNKFIINASDSRIIEKVKIKFNGVETEEQVNSETYSKEIDLVPGEPGTNTLIVTVYNKDGMPVTKKVWDMYRKK